MCFSWKRHAVSAGLVDYGHAKGVRMGWYVQELYSSQTRDVSVLSTETLKLSNMRPILLLLPQLLAHLLDS